MAKNKKPPIQSTAGFILKLIWLALAFTLFFVGMSYFNSNKGDNPIGAWLIWGCICLPAVLIPAIKTIIDSTKWGAAQGSKHYTATVSSDSVSVHNNTLKEAVIGFIGGLVGSLAAGPVTLGFYIFGNTVAVICYIILLILKRGNGNGGE